MLLLFLTGCSSTTFLYNRLDLLIPWYLGDYVDLNRQQKKTLDRLLQPFLAWHRQDELQLYIELLDRIEADLEDDISAEQIAAHANGFVAAWQRIEIRALQWMLNLGEDLSDEQMTAFIEKLWEKQRGYEDEYLPRSLEEYNEETYDNLLDSTQDFMGRLDWGQRAILEKAAADLQRSDGHWLEERELWVSRMEATLQREPGWQEGMHNMLATREETSTPEYRAIYEHNTAVICDAIARLLNSRMEKQDKRLRKTIGNFREDLETLIGQR